MIILKAAVCGPVDLSCDIFYPHQLDQLGEAEQKALLKMYLKR